MKRAFLLLCIVCRASLELRDVQSFYMSRKARSSTPPAHPVNNGFIYSRINSEPPTISTFDNTKIEETKETSKPSVGKLVINETLAEKCKNNANKTTTEVPASTTKKANESDSLASASSNMYSSYSMNHMYHSDDEDIRTDSRNYYDGWPYLYHTPYDYNSFKFDIEVEKAKDKRYVDSKMERIIPVFEDQEDITNSYIYSAPDYKHLQMYTDNPIYGNSPFFSHILSDYFDKTYDEDEHNYKGTSWGKEFDSSLPYQDIDDYSMRYRRLGEKDPKQSSGSSYSHTPMESLVGHDTQRDTVSSKSYDKYSGSDKSEKGSDNKHNYKSDYKYDGKDFKEFKDFADAFANRFGSEDHDRGSKFSIKNKANNGKKRKGFRNVYHKDEYKEQDDFFDDADNSVHTEEHGSSKFRVGGSEAYLGSHAVAAAEQEGNTINKSEDIESNEYDKKHEDSEHHKGMDSNFDQYRSLAKSTALSNSNYF